VGPSSVFAEFWFEGLKDGVNVIVVKHDGSDLLERLQWAKDHDKDARRIAQEGATLVAAALTDFKVDCYWALVVRRYIELHRRFTAACEQAAAAHGQKQQQHHQPRGNERPLR